jgi:hypothetical protein
LHKKEGGREDHGRTKWWSAMNHRHCCWQRKELMRHQAW